MVNYTIFWAFGLADVGRVESKSFKQFNKLCVIYRSVNFSANSLREDYKFHHTFSTEIAKFLKVSLGKLVVMQPEKFQSKYEPKSYVMDIKVGEGCQPWGVRSS